MCDPSLERDRVIAIDERERFSFNMYILLLERERERERERLFVYSERERERERERDFLEIFYLCLMHALFFSLVLFSFFLRSLVVPRLVSLLPNDMTERERDSKKKARA